MAKPNKYKLIPVIGLLLAFMLPGRVQASDLDIFGILREELQPNVLIVLDLSGSMTTHKDAKDKNGVLQTRIKVAKEVLTDIVNKFDDVRWGLMTFNSSQGKMVAECASRNETELAAFLKKLNGLGTSGSTAAASALAEAGLYFAGQPTFFWNTDSTADNTYRTGNWYDAAEGKYKSPIEHVCQKSYIIMVTDGAPSADSGFLSGTSVGYSNVEKNIFLKSSYIDGENGAPRPIQNYITDNNLGHLISNANDFVYTSWFDPLRNENITEEFTREDSFIGTADTELFEKARRTYLNWVKSEWQNDFFDNGFTWGYNIDNPSAAIPPPHFEVQTYEVQTGGTGTEEDPYQYETRKRTVVDISRFGYITLNPAGLHDMPIYHTQIARGNMYTSGTYASDYMDDVAAFLYNEDLMPGYGMGRYEKQNVKTFVVGLKIDIDLLKRTAVQGGTGINGYMKTDNQQELDDAFVSVMEYIMDDMATFASPAIPTPNDTDVYAGNKVYMSFFKPTEAAWVGNLKRFGLVNGSMSSNTDASGVIKDTVFSDWTASYESSPDGGDVGKGGALAALNYQFATEFINEGNEPEMELSASNALRKVYTYLGSSSDLTAGSNAFRTKNTAITEDVLGITQSSKRNRNEVISYIRNSRLGAIIHSSPVIMYYNNKAANAAQSNAVIYIGANDGMLHAIDDTDGKELWSFIMPEHLPELQYSMDETLLDERYYVDGQGAYEKIGNTSVVMFGARRGGNTYVALDVSNYAAPQFLYQISGVNAGDTWSDYGLGQSWGKPRFIKLYNTAQGVTEGNHGQIVKDFVNCIFKENTVLYTDAANEKDRWIAVLPGGYDKEYEKHLSVEVTNPKGAAVIGFNALTGEPHDAFKLLNKTQSPIMQHSVMDVAVLDLNNDLRLDTMYFGDMGGNLFYAVPYQMVVDLSNSCSGDKRHIDFKATTEFYPYLLYKESGTRGVTPADQRKVMYAPDVVIERDGEYVYFGTGDRETPMDRKVKNRFYSIKNKNASNGGLKFLENNTNGLSAITADTDLVDLTDNKLETSSDAQEKALILGNLRQKNGWYIELREAEKVVSTPVVYNGTVFFTTYIPSQEQSTQDDDLCRTGSTGKAYLYALDYITATSSMELENNAGNSRFVEIGDTIPTSPVIAIYKDKAQLFVGVGVGVYELPLNDSSNMIIPNLFYWSDMF